MSDRDIILFTGQSGMKIRKCLEKLKGIKGNVLPTLCIEHEMEKISGKEFLDILTLPRRILEQLWEEAFKKIGGRLPKSAKDGTYTFLTFHASYYHQRKTQLLSPINLKRLQDYKGRVKMIIVFVDDCYDIYKRLTAEGEMYDYIERLTPLEALSQSILNLISILAWREIEIAFSQKISQVLEIPLYIIAMKHPTFMVSRLIAKPPEELKILYLCHPIGSIRREQYIRLPSVIMELNEFTKNILKQRPNSVLFIPDTIDEKRIEQDTISGRYYPELSGGWSLPFPEEDWLFIPLPSNTKGINPLNPRNFDYHTSHEDVKAAISSSIGILAERIQDQINSRDHSLVEQSKDGVVVYRPYWGGYTSGGVKEEIKYNNDLRMRYGEKKRRTGIITLEEDSGKFRIRRLFTHLQASINIKDKSKLEALCQDWLNNSNKISEFYRNSWKQEEIRKSIENVLPKNYEFDEHFIPHKKTTLAPGRMLLREEERKEGWTKISEEVRKTDLLRKYTISEDRYLTCSKERLKQNLEDFIKNF